MKLIKEKLEIEKKKKLAKKVNITERFWCSRELALQYRRILQRDLQLTQLTASRDQSTSRKNGALCFFRGEEGIFYIKPFLTANNIIMQFHTWNKKGKWGRMALKDAVLQEKILKGLQLMRRTPFSGNTWKSAMCSVNILEVFFLKKHFNGNTDNAK